MLYEITVEHHSIAHARAVRHNGSLAEAMKIADAEFGDDFHDYLITIRYLDGPHFGTIAARRKVNNNKWNL